MRVSGQDRGEGLGEGGSASEQDSTWKATPAPSRLQSRPLATPSRTDSYPPTLPPTPCGPRGVRRGTARADSATCCRLGPRMLCRGMLPSDSSSNAVTSAGERQMDGGGPLVGEHAQADGWPSRVRVRVCVLRERARRSPSWSTAGAGPSASGPRFPAPLPRAWHGGQGQGGQPLP